MTAGSQVKKCSYVEYIETQKPYHRLPMSKLMLEQSKDLLTLPVAISNKKHSQIERILEAYIRKGIQDADSSLSQSQSSDSLTGLGSESD